MVQHGPGAPASLILLLPVSPGLCLFFYSFSVVEFASWLISLLPIVTSELQAVKAEEAHAPKL